MYVVKDKEKTNISLTKLSPMLDPKRIKFPATLNKILMERFQANKFPTKEERCQLAMSFNITEERITNWYKDMSQRKGAEEERLRQG